jgi:hypothetical protein
METCLMASLEVEDTSEVNEETEPVPPLNDFRFRLFR